LTFSEDCAASGTCNLDESDTVLDSSHFAAGSGTTQQINAADQFHETRTVTPTLGNNKSVLCASGTHGSNGAYTATLELRKIAVVLASVSEAGAARVNIQGITHVEDNVDIAGEDFNTLGTGGILNMDLLTFQVIQA